MSPKSLYVLCILACIVRLANYTKPFLQGLRVSLTKKRKKHTKCRGRIDAERGPRLPVAAPRLGGDRFPGKEFSEGGLPGQRLLFGLRCLLRHGPEDGVRYSCIPSHKGNL